MVPSLCTLHLLLSLNVVACLMFFEPLPFEHLAAGWTGYLIVESPFRIIILYTGLSLGGHGEGIMQKRP